MTVRLDVIYEVSVAYFNVLRAKTIERLYKDNLKLTQANLNRAGIRMSTGVAGPDEVYRWEIKFATDRITVLDKESITLDAMEAMNRILNRPLQELFIAEETDLSYPLLIVGDKLFLNLMNNPRCLHSFRNFAVEEAVLCRPELKSLDAANRNLLLVTDSYVQGIKSIIDLLDAQNQAFTADQAAANAVYNFLLDLMGVSGGAGYYHRNSWDYDRYYRSRVNHHYHRTDVYRSTRPVNGSRPVRVRRRLNRGDYKAGN